MAAFEDVLDDLAFKYRDQTSKGTPELNARITATKIELMNKIDVLGNQLTISNRRVDMLELRLEGKLSDEEYKRLQSMYNSVDTDNHYLADQAVASLKKNL